jgi:hypothetical protein
MTAETAKKRLEDDGFVVLRAKSYRQAQERQHIAEALLRSEVEHAEATRQWASNCLDEERRLRDRCTHLYGLAKSLGATREQLAETLDG